MTDQHLDELAIIQRLFGAFGTGDAQAFLSLLAQDIEWHIPGSPAIPYAGSRRGRKAVADWLALFASHVEVKRFEPREFIHSGPCVVVLGSESLLVRATGKKAENQWAMTFLVKDGLVHRFHEYIDTAAIVNAFSSR